MGSPASVIKQIGEEQSNDHNWSRRRFVAWVNETLAANYKDISEFRNGALYLQLLDMLFPGSARLSEIIFHAETESDCYKNFESLQNIFTRLDIKKKLDAESLSTGKQAANWRFLLWFKKFFDTNYDGKEYDALSLRKGAYMGFGKDPKRLEIFTDKTEIERRHSVPLRNKFTKTLHQASRSMTADISSGKFKSLASLVTKDDNSQTKGVKQGDSGADIMPTKAQPTFIDGLKTVLTRSDCPDSMILISSPCIKVSMLPHTEPIPANVSNTEELNRNESGQSFTLSNQPMCFLPTGNVEVVINQNKVPNTENADRQSCNSDINTGVNDLQLQDVAVDAKTQSKVDDDSLSSQYNELFEMFLITESCEDLVDDFLKNFRELYNKIIEKLRIRQNRKNEASSEYSSESEYHSEFI